MGKKSKSANDNILSKSVPKGSHTGCLFYHLVWPRWWIPPERYLRVRTCNVFLNFEIYSSTSDITSITSRNLIWLKLGCSGFICVIFMRFHVVGFLVDDLDVPAFEVYRPVVSCVRGETMTWHIFFLSSKSFIAPLKRYTQVSYQYIKGSKMEI